MKLTLSFSLLAVILGVLLFPLRSMEPEREATGKRPRGEGASEESQAKKAKLEQTQANKLLHEALALGDTAKVKEALERGANPNLIVTIKGKELPALHHAVTRGQVEIVQELLQHGADINLLDKDKHSPLEVAVGMYDAVASLLTPVPQSRFTYMAQLYQQLIEMLATAPGLSREILEKALIFAVQLGCPEIVRLLLPAFMARGGALATARAQLQLFQQNSDLSPEQRERYEAVGRLLDMYKELGILLTTERLRREPERSSYLGLLPLELIQLLAPYALTVLMQRAPSPAPPRSSPT
jgi:hypothetical protein